MAASNGGAGVEGRCYQASGCMCCRPAAVTTHEYGGHAPHYLPFL